jgi:hypothetical protein
VTAVEITAVGSDVDLVVANIRERLDEQFGEGEWSLVQEFDPEEDSLMGFSLLGGNPRVEMALSAGGSIATVKVTMHVVGERLSTLALPRAARS